MRTDSMSKPAARALACAALAALLFQGPAAWAANRAQAGVTLGVYSTWDLAADSSVTGNGWRDGALVQTVNAVNDSPSGSIQLYNGASSVHIEMQAQAGLQQAGGAPALAVDGSRVVESDLLAGTMALQSRSGHVASPAPLERRLAYVQGHSFAELFQFLEVRWAKDHVGPVEVQLSLTLDGEVLRNDGSDGWLAGVNVYLQLGNVATGVPPLEFPFPEPLARFESGVTHERLSIGGGFLNSQCSARADTCESFVSIYAAIDLTGRRLADGSIDVSKGAAHDFRHTAQIHFTSSPGLTVLNVDPATGQLLALPTWVNPAPVPEPAAAWLLVAGLAALLGRARRRAVAA